MKRFIAFALAVILAASVVMMCVSAFEGPKTMLLLGDSITTGYGLENYVPGASPYECRSYGNIIAEALGLKGRDTYINKAVNGDTSSDLLALIPKIEDDIKKSDLIVISIGGNDLLTAFPTVVKILAGKEVNSVDDAIEFLVNADPSMFSSFESNRDLLIAIGAVYANYTINMAVIASELKELAPNARIMFLEQYNPMKDVEGFELFGEMAAYFIDTINETIKNACEVAGFEAIDVPSVLDQDAAGMTNILDFDIHPNAAGHREIAKLIASKLGVTLNLPEENTTEATEPVTTPEPVITTEPTPVTTAAPVVTTAPTPVTTPAPVVTTAPTPVTTPAPVVTTAPAPVTTSEQIVTTSPITTAPPVTTTEPITTEVPITTDVQTVATEPATEPETTPVVPSETDTEVTTDDQTLERPGCFAALSGAAVIVACACGVILMKKENN